MYSLYLYIQSLISVKNAIMIMNRPEDKSCIKLNIIFKDKSMKKNFLILLFSSLQCGHINAQEALFFTEIIQVEGASKKELFDKAKIWFAETYPDAKEGLQIQDIENGVLLGKGVLKLYSNERLKVLSNEYVSYNIKVLTKDGKYKCEIYDFYHYCYRRSDCVMEYGGLSTDIEYPRMPWTIAKKKFNKDWANIKAKAEQHAKSLFITLKNGMTKATKDW